MPNNVRIHFTYKQAHKTQLQLLQQMVTGDAVLVARHERALLAFFLTVELLHTKVNADLYIPKLYIGHLQLKFSLD